MSESERQAQDESFVSEKEVGLVCRIDLSHLRLVQKKVS